ncbi:MAG: alpha/beta hydrolase-fold protein [Ferruginibacter sp.]
MLKNHNRNIIRLYVIGILLMYSGCSFSQYTIRMQLVQLPAGHVGDSVFISGNFNNWNPASGDGVFKAVGDNFHLELNNLSAGEYQFKFTRGNWGKVEVDKKGLSIENRTIKLISDTVIQIAINSWMDDFPPFVKEHTTSPNVHIIDTAFYIPQLDRTRRVWLYLPPDYAKSTRRYPVIYMNDGQNLFDDYTAPFGEWAVDESIDSLVKKNKPACIVVGIDNGEKSMNEYNPYEYKDFGKGEGDAYVDFLAKSLKPYIDKQYRTMPGSKTTVVAGSSMGGLISYYAMLKYPSVFGKGGIFSPAFHTAPQIQHLTDSLGKQLTGKIFFYMGEKEGKENIDEMIDVTETLGRKSSAIVYIVLDPDAERNEAAWRKWFPDFYEWTLANGFNDVIKVN